MRASQQYAKFIFLTLCVFAYCIFYSAKSWAVACDAIFTNGIQATGASGNITLSYHSIITGGSATLKTKALTDNSSWVACSGSSCVGTGVAATTSTVTFSTGSGTNGTINVADKATDTKPAGDYSTVTVGQFEQAMLTFSTANGTYKTRAFTTGFQSIVQLQSGDYWINGNLTLGQETILRRVASSGTTRIFVNGNVSLGFKVTTQSFTSAQLLIYATGTFTSADQANLNAFIYAGGAVSLGFQSSISGGISGSSFLASGNDVSVAYQPSAFTTANFAPFCSGTTVVPVLLGSWNMDELNWNGTAGEVKDTSGNNNHGRASVSTAGGALPSTTSGVAAYTAGLQSTCRYGAFDGTGSPSRLYDYVELSGFPTLPNGFTFAAWIRSTNAGAQHQRILVRDDGDNGWGLSLADGTGNPALRFFNRNVTNNGAVTGQGTNPNCGVFCVDTNAVITSNTWYYVAAAVDTAAKTVTLYVYNQAGTLQAKAVGAYSGTWVDGGGTVGIGGETSASSEGRQTSWHFLGNIDEVNIYSGALAQTAIESLRTTVRTCPAPDHYELDVPATSVSCLGSDITVRVCADSVSPCTKIYTVDTNVTLASSVGTLNFTTFPLTEGDATVKLLYPTLTEGATATVTLSGEATAATNARKCCIGGTCTVANSCTTTFNTAGFIFSKTITGGSDIPANQVAGKSSTVADGTMTYLRAVKTNTSTGTCVARFTSPQTVKMGYKCVNPTTCVAGQSLQINTATIPGSSNATNPPTYGNVTLSFDSNGSAPVPINYSDVGQIQLFANLALGLTSTDPAYTLVGQSSAFVVKPYTLATVLTGNPKGTSAAGTAAGFVPAGSNFIVKIEAKNAAGGLTPNFGKESTTPETVQLGNLKLIYPAGGAATALTYGENFAPTTPAGTFVNNKVSWEQVGSFTVEARMGDSNYLGAGDLDTITTSDIIGRIYPDHFRLDTPVLSNSCGNFTYMDQPMALSYSIKAESSTNKVLSNYGGNYAVTVPSYVAENANDGSGIVQALASRFVVALSPPPVWNNGNFTVPIGTSSVFSRKSPSNAPDGPFSDLRIGLSMKDQFDFRALQALDMNAATTATPCGVGCDAKQLGNQLDLRYGRMRLDDAFGPETFGLNVNFVTESWVGNRFIVNPADSCTRLELSAVKYPKGFLSSDANRTVDLTSGATSGTTQGTYTTLPGNTFIGFNAGNAGQQFSAPTNSAQGSFIVSVDLTNFPWLRFDWNQDGNYSDVKLPDATFTFGSYRGNDRIIYWRERLQ